MNISSLAIARPYAAWTTGDLERMLLLGEGGHVVADAAVAALPPASEVDRLIDVARELWLRGLERERGVALRTPQCVRQYLRDYLAAATCELFLVVYLDHEHRPIATEEAFRGTLSHCSVHPREIVKRALQLNASAVVLAHNHPSGVAEPSRPDELLTRNLKDVLEQVEVRLLDHVIVAGPATVTFVERGLL
jgi:DNA repair protein RadC